MVEDNPAEQFSIKELLGYDDINVTVVSTGEEAVEAVRQESYDCVVLDLRLPDISGFEVLERFRDTPTIGDLPVIVFTGKELSPEEDARLHSLARSVVVKGVPRNLLNGCWMRLLCFCTELFPIFPRRSRECSTACTVRMMR